MNVVFCISGREAIPVRAIPYVTGWDVSPDMVAQSLANSSDGVRLDRLTACQYHVDGSHTPILPKEWDGIEDLLRGLSASLEAKNSNRDITRPQWLKESIPLLPAGVFVWRDELENSWFRFSAQTSTRKGERPNDGMLNFSPMIPGALLREQVCEGLPFQRAVTESAPQVPPPTISDRQSILRRRKSVTIQEAAELLTGIEGWTKENRAAIALIREAVQNGELEPESVRYWNEDAWTFDGSRAAIDQFSTTITLANFDAWRAFFPAVESHTNEISKHGHAVSQAPTDEDFATGRDDNWPHTLHPPVPDSTRTPNTIRSGETENAAEANPRDWMRDARAIADECFEHDTQNNCRDSLDGYSRRVTDEMQKRNIHGPRGLIDNHKTVQRDALQGEKWWKHKKK
ncbi:MAG: hypothetical protein AW10_03013 [Candidatus Accumulibacter appositus]|uniref:Uncharacterized protein n=1 Tax=Candidatus Accumulibacter appositus TaxID=1454003 RepID=A0A011QI71_9PROT|nr:hypothetical protein [Accumulibacter sp.]EXI78529.1 MAG: hypothetical protein AW10_03013 [Candidatus Accumulibacter appositus]HRF05929.1 hypothetical protein [Accumulibacter sp.]